MHAETTRLRRTSVIASSGSTFLSCRQETCCELLTLDGWPQLRVTNHAIMQPFMRTQSSKSSVLAVRVWNGCATRNEKLQMLLLLIRNIRLTYAETLPNELDSSSLLPNDCTSQNLQPGNSLQSQSVYEVTICDPKSHEEKKRKYRKTKDKIKHNMIR